ncbi:aminotransferase class V-fold PLP-dependent enzyme [Bacillus toyonensis]|uniref:aminotransferase class V-fold PLP-dependent enzyme n=1 Tax=Bacillus toyonensis TaxID=155322 RepID=UPI00253F7080|nr:aminotransferase class V-fold PLP-dependent enzyme [Bacillus toyonensis]WIG44688.1 aminotransferase class V-fold PLP-dependent enzyme [Bacillus toyonensis]
MNLTYKIANQDWEFQQIHELNYKTFVEEIPQHTQTPEQIRIDPFHAENTYLICLKDKQLIGMVAVRNQRPFSLDHKIPQLDNYLPSNSHHIYEIRLLAMMPKYRNGRAFLGLIRFLHRFLLLNGYDLALISGTTRELSLYQQMGFQPFYTEVGTKEAAYQPMYVTPTMLENSKIGKLVLQEYSFLPGPVDIEKNVQKAYATKPISHRSNQFILTMQMVQEKLQRMTRTNYVQIMLGSGTLANDAIAWQLRSLSGKGLILSNGEFGNRLVQQAKQVDLRFDVYREKSGTPFDYEKIKDRFQTYQYDWVWFVHHETSVGILNKLESLVQLGQEYNVKLCVDCISSIGATSLDLQGVYLASGVSGKAIGSYTGLAFVFHNHSIFPHQDIPAYLDVGRYFITNSIPYTQSWNLLFALQEALQKYDDFPKYENIKKCYIYMEKKLHEMGLKIVVPKEHTSFLILTVVLEDTYCSETVGDSLALQGYILHYKSDYLREKNWIQIACFNLYKKREMEMMLSSLECILKEMNTN